MRFGWLAAAAALVCAGQAGAQRYLQVQITGSFTVPTYVSTGPYSGFLAPYSYVDTQTAIFDLAKLPSAPDPSGYFGESIPVYDQSAYDPFLDAHYGSSQIGVVSLYGPVAYGYNFSINLNDVSDALSNINFSGSSFEYDVKHFSRYTNPVFGRIENVQAQIIDGPIGIRGFTDSLLLTSVPEPASWVMMIAGIGAIGALLRRRRRPELRAA